jgi:chloramphenicol O-acetyltransferase type A
MKPEPSFRVLDIDQWSRKDHFELYRHYDDPFFNITANVDVTYLVQHTRVFQKSFFLYALHTITKAANEISNFKFRLHEQKVIEYDLIHPGCTLLNPDKTFRFCYFTYQKEVVDFETEGNKLVESLAPVELDPKWNALNMIHCSMIPWISFTSFKHARRKDPTASIPRITMGKFFESGNQILMPLSVEVHHALVDGYHVGQYFEAVERNCADFSVGE